MCFKKQCSEPVGVALVTLLVVFAALADVDDVAAENQEENGQDDEPEEEREQEPSAV